MKFRRKRVVVIGAGPAGLFAAHAAEQLGYQVEVYTAPGRDNAPKKSELHGCQYLHASIPDVTYSVDGVPVRYELLGSGEGYRRKVYGDNWYGQVSPDEYGPEKDHYAWDLREAYDKLWSNWEHCISALEVTPNLAARIGNIKAQIVLCTVPATALCLRQADHKFNTQSVWAMGTREDGRPFWTLPYYAPNMTVQCNGDKDTRWYRAATVFGHSTLEWPGGSRPPIDGVVAVHKPLSTDCDCHVGRNWRRLGRYGQWKKGVLVHQVYEEVREMLR